MNMKPYFDAIKSENKTPEDHLVIGNHNTTYIPLVRLWIPFYCIKCKRLLGYKYNPSYKDRNNEICVYCITQFPKEYNNW